MHPITDAVATGTSASNGHMRVHNLRMVYIADNECDRNRLQRIHFEAFSKDSAVRLMLSNQQHIGAILHALDSDEKNDILAAARPCRPGSLEEGPEVGWIHGLLIDHDGAEEMHERERPNPGTSSWSRSVAKCAIVRSTMPLDFPRVYSPNLSV